MNEAGVVVPEVTDTQILGLFGVYRALSNFHECPVEVDGRVFGNSEAAYMAEKTDDEVEKDKLAGLKPADAKKFGQTVTLKKDWDKIKDKKMLRVLMKKFEQNPKLALLLDQTGNKYIEETNWWGDKYWGKCGGEGENMLGIVLMEVRSRLRNKTKA